MKRSYHPSILVRAGLVLTLLAVAASGQESSQAQPSQEGGATPIDAREMMNPTGNNTVAAPVDPNSYLIGPEDQLAVRVWREEDVSANVVVRPDGQVSLPLIGEVQAAGKTPLQLKDIVAEKLSQFLTRPEVMISVIAIRSKKYYITGQVGHTGAFPLVVPITVLEALSSAGGFQQWASRKKIIILRGNQRLKFNYNQVTKGKKMEQNIYLENGDHIIVP
jgi:polysaccharide biosynthesis/export protein